nr:hypothetical protein [Arenibaculum pallidiluteum]
MPFRLLRLLPGLAALLPITGCGDFGRVTQGTVDPAYRPETVSAGTAEHGMPVRIHGAIDGFAPDRLSGMVLDSLRRSTGGIGLRFTTADVPPGRLGDYRTVFVFNPAAGMTDGDVCAGRFPGTKPSASEITVRAALCWGGKNLTGAMGFMNADAARDARRFDRFLRDIGHALFPRSNPDR